MKKSTLLALSALVACSGAVAWAVATPAAQPVVAVPAAETGETTLTITTADVEWVGANGNNTYTTGWRSTTTPRLSLICDDNKNNMTLGGDVFRLHSGLASNSLNYTLSVPGGWVITGVSFDYKNATANPTSLTFNGKDYTGTAEYQKVEATGLEVASIKIKVTDSNKGVFLDKFTVTVKEGDAPAPEEPENPIAPQIPAKLPYEAPVPECVQSFVTSTVNGNTFAADTKWYNLYMCSSSYVLSEGSDEYIPLNATQHNGGDGESWCFAGNDTDGYTIYNKAAGTGKMLAAPKQMKGQTGAESFAVLKAPGDDAYCYKWDFSSSSNLSGKKGWYINQHGEPAKKLNNRGNKLAFWDAGQDAGSTFWMSEPMAKAEHPSTIPAPYIMCTANNNPLYGVQYRIPAIAVVGAGKHAGRIIIASDYRYSWCDIGQANNCHTDLHISISDDNGKTWTWPDFAYGADGQPVTDATGIGLTSESLDHPFCAFSDPALVADRESGRLMMVSCGGNSGFFGSRWPNNPQHLIRWISEDGGDTWTRDIQTEQVYKLFEGKAYNGQRMDGMFIGSGKMHQSRHVKVGKYYRVYAAMSTQINGGTLKNYVIYSDDFGDTWAILGGAERGAIENSGDEPKCEELPDGSVAILARRNGGNRNYNIFVFSNPETAEGEWMTEANNLGFGDINVNACNGEPLMVPAVDKKTGEKTYLLLQSVPFGPGGRVNVGIFWKKMADASDFSSPAKLGSGWDGSYQVSTMGSAYSTMALAKNGEIAFVYEENTFGPAYTEVVRMFSLSDITNGAYDYTPDTDGAIEAAIGEKVNLTFEQSVASLRAILETEPKYVGHLAPTTKARVTPLIESYLETQDNATLSEINRILKEEGAEIGITEGVKYRMINCNRTPTRWMSVDARNQLNGVPQESDACDFRFVAVDPAGRAAKSLPEFYIQHVNTGRYVAATGANETRIPLVETTAEAAVYTPKIQADGYTSLICKTPNGGNSSLHLAGDCERVVPWEPAPGSPASGWYVAPENIEDAIVTTGIEEIIAAPSKDKEAYFDIYGRPVATPARGQMIVTSKGRKFIAR